MLKQSQFTKTQQQIAMKLLQGARGDLALDVDGDVRYGWEHNPNIHEENFRRPVGPKLLLIKWDAENGAHWVVTRAGAEWALENLSGGYWNVRQEKCLEAIQANRMTDGAI